MAIQLTGIICKQCGRAVSVTIDLEEVAAKRVERDAKIRLLLGTVLTTQDLAIVHQQTVEALELLQPEKDEVR
jgi:hypothetical protein